MCTVYRFLFGSEWIAQLFIEEITRCDGVLKCYTYSSEDLKEKKLRSVVSVVVEGSLISNDIDTNLKNLISFQASEYDGIPFGSSIYSNTSLEEEFVKKIRIKKY